MNKHYNLFCLAVGEEEESFANLTHSVKVMKLFFFIAEAACKSACPYQVLEVGKN
jgi:hypothetical protein